MKALRQLERVDGKFTHWAVQYMDARRDGSTVFTTWAGVARKKGGSAQGCFGECVGTEEANAAWEKAVATYRVRS